MYAPTDIGIYSPVVLENSRDHAYINRLYTFDPDPGDNFTYTLLDDAGGRFGLVDDALFANGSLIDYESAASHTIIVRSTDQWGLFVDKAIMITVVDVGGPWDDVFIGGDGNDYFLYDRLFGSKIIDGGAGVDTLAVGPDVDVSALQISNVEIFDALNGCIISFEQLLSFAQVTSSNSADARIWFSLTGISETLDFSKILDAGHSVGVGPHDMSIALEITGTSYGDALYGSYGSDILIGGDGNDTIEGGGGANDISGGSGDDELSGNGQIHGGDGNDTIHIGDGTNFGDAGDDIFIVQGGAGIVDGGDGIDRVQMNGSLDLGSATFRNVEVLELEGSDQWPSYVAGSISQLLSFSQIVVPGYTVIFKLNGDGGTLDFGQRISDFAIDASELTSALSFTKRAYGTNVTGSAFADTIATGDGVDLLIGGGGADTLQGGAGNDWYNIDASDTVVELADQGADSVGADFSYTLLANFENLRLTGEVVADGTGNVAGNEIVGNEAANVLLGLEGNDTLNGGAGDDSLYGGSGDDTLFGGAGTNILDGGAGNDTYYAFDENYVGYAISDTIVEAADGGIDTVVVGKYFYTLGANLENMIMGDVFGGAARGNDLDNTITGDSAGNYLYGLDGRDTLFGGVGYDTLLGGAGIDKLDGGEHNDYLDGGAGDDALIGGDGDDTFVVDSVRDVVTETNADTASGGSDRMISFVSRTLAANVEYLTLAGSASLNGSGNGLDNRVIGNAGDNILNGGGGRDILSGGAGKDNFVFSTGLDAATNRDFIADFNAADDTIRLTKDGAGMFNALDRGGLKGFAFHAAAGAKSGHDGNDRIVYDTTTGALYYDADGSGSGAAIHFATLKGAPALTSADFVVV